MIFRETELRGVFIIEPEIIEDERGFFACSWTPDEFAKRGLNPRLVQCNISFNKRRGTLRGMHFQNKPHEEAKLVRCTRGAIYDVAIDMRRDSPTRHRWVAVELSGENHRMLHIPEGFAHGYQTLTDSAEIFYQMSEYYHPESAGGVRWDDPAFGIQLPLEVTVIAQRDANYPLLDATTASGEFRSARIPQKQD
jgi:dTDP-4-dehydrorhamnose 3,5-epimerase